MAFGIVEGSEFCSGFVEFCMFWLVLIQQSYLGPLQLALHILASLRDCLTGVRCENRAATLSLISDDPTHLAGLAMGISGLCWKT